MLTVWQVGKKYKMKRAQLRYPREVAIACIAEPVSEASPNAGVSFIQYDITPLIPEGPFLYWYEQRD